MKKHMLLSLISCIFILLAATQIAVSAGAYETAAITVTDVFIPNDSTADSFEMTIDVSNNPGIALTMFGIKYDSTAFELSEVKNGSVFESSEITDGNMSANPYRFVAYTTSSDTTKNGTLVTLKFNIKDSSGSGTHNFEIVDFEAYNLNEAEIAFDIINGSVEIEPPKLTLDHVTCHKGETLKVPIRLEGNPGMSLLMFGVDYPSEVFTLKEVECGEVFDNADITAGNLHGIPYRFLAMRTNGNATSSGILATLVFDVNENCYAGDYNISLCDIEAYNIYENDIAITQTCGVISVLDKPVVTATQNITAHPGDTINIPVNITQNPGISTIAMSINYDTNAMTLKSVSNGEIFNVSEMYSGIISQTPYILSFLKPTGNVTATGNLAVLEFEINPDCEQSTYPVDIAVEEVYNFDETAVPFKSTKSHITVNSRVISGVTLDDKTTVYNGQSQFLELVGTLPDNAVVEWSPDSELIDTGIYPVTATIMARGYETLSLNAFLTIEPKTISSELCALNKMYDGSNSATLSVGDLIGVVEGDNISLIGPYKGHFETSNAGQRIKVIPDGDFVLTGPDADNYIFNLPELYADITKIPVTVTANNSSKIHGASDPELTYDYNGTLLGNDVFKGSLEREQGEAAGEYAITQGSLYISDNYEIIFIPATFNILGELSVSLSQTVISADSETAVIEISVSNNYGLSTLNLDINYDNTKFSLDSIDKGTIFDAEDLLYTDNGGNIRLTASSDEITSENGVLATLTFDITEPPMPGLYNISINSISANGKAGEAITALTENGSIKILGKIAGITLENTAFTYDGEEKTLEISGILPYGGKVEYTNNKHTTAGTYNVSAKITAENYEDLVLTTDMTILPAPLYIDGMTAQNKSYDGTDRAILSGGSIRGIIGNDDVRVLMPASGTFSSKNAREHISVTPADFVITGTQASNYTVIYPELYADIGKAPVTVTATPASKFWGDEDPELTYTVSDGTLFGDDTFTGSLSRTPGSFVGTYEITPGTLEITNGDNYEINFVQSEFTILADETLPSQPTDSIITVSPVTSTRGRSASVILNLNNNNGISDISFDVIFDSSAMTSDQITTFWGATIENIVSQSDNRFTVNLKNIPFNADDNRLTEFKFDIDPHAVIGEYPIKITNIVAYADSNISNVVCPNVGILTVRDFIYGDANGDYILDRLDLLCIAKHFSGWDVEIFAEACDVTADGKFDRCDLLRLAKYFSGYDVELG